MQFIKENKTEWQGPCSFCGAKISEYKKGFIANSDNKYSSIICVKCLLLGIILLPWLRLKQ